MCPSSRDTPGYFTCLMYSNYTRDLGLRSHPKDHCFVSGGANLRPLYYKSIALPLDHWPAPNISTANKWSWVLYRHVGSF